MKDAKAFCHRCETEFTVYVTDEDLNRGVGYGNCPGCGKEGKFSLVATNRADALLAQCAKKGDE